MDGLETRFEDRIDFFHLDVDDATPRTVADRFDIRGHTQYVLIDAEGKVLRRWFSYLDQENVTTEIEETLASLETQN